MARAQLVDPQVTRWYHCITGCVRQALLLGGPPDRKAWIDRRLQELAEIFAASVAGFAVLDNHLHVLLRLDPDDAAAWPDDEVARHWGRLFPPRDRYHQPLPVTDAWVQAKLQDVAWLARTRQRLQSLSWFMKCLKEPLARLANRQDQTRGAFFEGRFKSVAILDEQSLLTTCIYIDLNPVAAGLAEVPERSDHTSLKERVEHVQAQGRIADLSAAQRGSVAGSAAAAGLEESLWLCPIEDRRRIDSTREGMIEGFSLGSYLLLADSTGRFFREGKAAIAHQLAGILERLGSSVESWQARLEKLSKGRVWGRFFAATRQRLREAAAHLGLRRLANFGGRLAL
jgi:hypothetical protein